MPSPSYPMDDTKVALQEGFIDDINQAYANINDLNERVDETTPGPSTGPHPLTGWLHVDGYGAVGDGTTDDTAAILAAFADIPDPAGNEVGGATVYFPPGTYLCNDVDAGTILKLADKPNVTLFGNGRSSELRTTTATATELLRIDTCTGFKIEGLTVGVYGTADIVHAIHYTTDSPGSAHQGKFNDLYINGNNFDYRQVFDIYTEAGSPIVRSAQADFSAGDVDALIMIDDETGPFVSTILSVATRSTTLSASINASTTTIPLNAVLTGAPASGYTIKVGTERMYVISGGDTTSLTVARAMGPDLIGGTHSSGTTVSFTEATLDDNVPTQLFQGQARIEPDTGSHMRYGLSIGADHPGASNLDIAQTKLDGVTVACAAVAGVQVGNGTTGNILDQWAYGLSVSQSGYGVYMNGGSISVHGGDMGKNLTDIRRAQVVSQEVEIDGLRTELSGRFYDLQGAGTGGPLTKLSSIEIQRVLADDGIVIRHLNSASLHLEDIDIQASVVAAGSVYIVAQGNSSNPCHLFALNVSSSGGNGNPFIIAPPNCIRTIINLPFLDTDGTVYPGPVGILTDQPTTIGHLTGNTTIGDGTTTGDRFLVVDPSSSDSAGVRFRVASTDEWWMYLAGGDATHVYVRDIQNSRMAADFRQGDTLTGLAKFNSPVASASSNTAGRPSASTAGAGARWYDTTLSKPIWSDGSVWRDAAGTAV